MAAFNILNDMNTLYLVESEEQVIDLTSKGNADDATWIALTPFSMYALEKRGIQYNIPEDFYTNDALCQVGIESGKTVNEICRRLDDLSISNSEALRKRAIRLYTDYNYPLYVIFDTVFSRVFQLKSIFESLRPDKVVCYKSEDYPFCWRGIGFDNRESLYSRLLDECKWKENVIVFSLPSKHKPAVSGNLAFGFNNRLNALKHHIKNRLPLLQDIRKNGIMRYLMSLPSVFDEHINIALIGGDYEWEECKYRFSLEKVNIEKLDIKHEECGNSPAAGDIKNEISKMVKDLLIFRGKDISGLLLARLNFIYQTGSVRCAEAYDHAQKEISRIKPRALLFSALATPEWRSAASAFAQKNIPTFCKSHGAAGFYGLMKTEDSELFYANNYLANTGEVADFYSKYINKYAHNGLRVISTGSPKLELLKRSTGKITPKLKKWLKTNGNGKKICIYATTAYAQNIIFIHGQPTELDRVLFKTQKTIIDFFKKRDDSVLIWKLHPNNLFDRPPAIENSAENIFVVKGEMQFTDLFEVADLMILDMPQTTCLQALTCRLPMFLVMKHVLFFDKAKELIERRAVCRNEPETLLEEIASFLENGTYEADIMDDSFFKTYGNEDGRDAVENTVSAVLDRIAYKHSGFLKERD